MNDFTLRDTLLELADSPPVSEKRTAMVSKANDDFPTTAGYLLWCITKEREKGNSKLVSFFEGALFMLYAFANANKRPSGNIIVPEHDIDITNMYGG